VTRNVEGKRRIRARNDRRREADASELEALLLASENRHVAVRVEKPLHTFKVSWVLKMDALRQLDDPEALEVLQYALAHLLSCIGPQVAEVASPMEQNRGLGITPGEQRLARITPYVTLVTDGYTQPAE
jgi:hypothetical protein